MPRRYYSNLANPTTLTAGIASGATTIAVPSTTGYPAVPFTIGLARGTASEEIVLVGGKTASSFTGCIRGYDGTAASSHLVDVTVEHVVASIDYTESAAHIYDTALDAHTQYHNTARHAAVSHTTAMLADAAVTTAKLDDAAVTLAKMSNASVGTAQIVNASITADKIAAGTLETISLADDSVSTAKIQASAVTGAKIANATISSDKIISIDPAIIESDIAGIGLIQAGTGALSVQTAEGLTIIGGDSVGIASSGVTSIKIANGNVGSEKLASGAVTVDKLAANSVTAVKIADNNVGTSKLVDGSVTTAKLAGGSVTNAKLGGSSVTSDKLAGALTLTGDTNFIPSGVLKFTVASSGLFAPGMDGSPTATSSASVHRFGDSGNELLYDSSSEAGKENIVPIADAGDLLDRLSPVRFSVKDTDPVLVRMARSAASLDDAKKPSKAQIRNVRRVGFSDGLMGFTAESVYRVDPAFATTDSGDRPTGISDRAVLAVTVATVKEDRAAVKEMQATIAALQARVDELSSPA